MSANLEIQWVHSTIGCPLDQRGTIKGLGFRRLHEKRTVVDTPQTRGMINKVSHLVTIIGARVAPSTGKAGGASPSTPHSRLLKRRKVKYEKK